MRRIAIIIMTIMLNRAKKTRLKHDNSVILQAYDHMIDTYESTIEFLKHTK